MSTPKHAQPEQLSVTLKLDGQMQTQPVDARDLLVTALRSEFGATAPHIGCESGRCGACAVLVDGAPVKSCMMLAVQADGAEVITARGLAEETPEGKALQSAFQEHHALQCGYCTPGMLSSAIGLLRTNLSPSDDDVRQALRGNLCRCTGYEHIIEAVISAAASLSQEGQSA